ncbi:TPA: hypothetical protein ACKPZ6_002445 [Serratia liquefaciens]
MTNKLSELSKPVAWTWNAYGMQHATTEEDESAELILDGVDVNPLYSQEYVSALLSQIEADREIKARLCRESNSLHDRLKAAEKRIAELEQDELAMRVSSRAVHEAQENHINQQQDIIESLEKKNVDLGRALGAAEKRLATPVRLSCETHPRCRTQHAKDVRTAGFTVEGNE